METELEMTQMLKLADMDFKVAIITLLKDIKENTLLMHKKEKRNTHLSRDTKENQMEILELRKYNINNESFTEWF